MRKSKTSGETSWKETKFGIIPRSKIIQLEIRGTQRGLQLLQKISVTRESLSIDLIKRIHKVCFEDILQDRAGVFRTIQVEYSGKEAPHFSKIHEMMQNLVNDIAHGIKQFPVKTSDDYIDAVVELLALFQHRFVVIHPFLDYNGRMSRMFTNYLLMWEQLPTIEISVTTKLLRNKYIQSLQKADNGDYKALQIIIEKALNESLSAISL